MSKLVRPVTPDEVHAFNVAGVVHLRGILDLATVNDLRHSIDEAIETLCQSAAGYDLTSLTKAAECDRRDALEAESKGQHDVAAIVDFIKASGQPFLFDKPARSDGSFLIDTGVAARHKGFRRICNHGAVPEIAGALLESMRVHFFGDQIFVKEPGTRERTAFHQDAAYFDIEGDQCCVMWIPVDPVTTETGGMMYVRGSHRDATHYAPNVFVSRARLPGSEGDLIPDIEGNLDDPKIVQFDVEPGDVLVHHYKTIHGSGGNLSRYQVRRAASLRYCGDDIRIKSKPGTPRQMHLTAELAEGSALSGADFPVVWMRKKQKEAA